jgi:hypothetical protein
MPNNQVAQDDRDIRVNDIDGSVKFENDTTHIEGELKTEEQDGFVTISDAENKRMRRKIHARSVFVAILLQDMNLADTQDPSFDVYGVHDPSSR